MQSYTIQILDFGDGCMRWNMRLDRIFQYTITTFGMIGQLHITMKTFMKVVI